MDWRKNNKVARSNRRDYSQNRLPQRTDVVTQKLDYSSTNRFLTKQGMEVNEKAMSGNGVSSFDGTDLPNFYPKRGKVRNKIVKTL